MNRGDRHPPRAYVARPASGPRSAAPGGGPSGHGQRARLEALFGGGRAGDPPRHATASRLSSAPRRAMGRTPSEYRMRRERLRLAREPDDIREACDQYLKFHQLPDDVDILVKVLHHPDEDVLRDALGQITSLFYQGRLHSTLLLCERLDAIEARPSLSDPIRSLLTGLRELLAKKAAEAAQAEPTAAQAGPTVAEAERTAAQAEPTAAEAEPTVAQAQPTAAEAEPTVAQAQPTAAEAKPTAAQGEPEPG